jgi:hypothetical protein
MAKGMDRSRQRKERREVERLVIVASQAPIPQVIRFASEDEVRRGKKGLADVRLHRLFPCYLRKKIATAVVTQHSDLSMQIVEIEAAARKVLAIEAPETTDLQTDETGKLDPPADTQMIGRESSHGGAA